MKMVGGEGDQGRFFCNVEVGLFPALGQVHWKLSQKPLSSGIVFSGNQLPLADYTKP